MELDVDRKSDAGSDSSTEFFVVTDEHYAQSLPDGDEEKTPAVDETDEFEQRGSEMVVVVEQQLHVNSNLSGDESAVLMEEMSPDHSVMDLNRSCLDISSVASSVEHVDDNALDGEVKEAVMEDAADDMIYRIGIMQLAPERVDSGAHLVDAKAEKPEEVEIKKEEEDTVAGVKKEEDTTADDSASSPPPNSNENQETYESFVGSVEPMINDLLTKLESRPEYIPRMLERFGQSLQTRNWGLTIIDDSGAVNSTRTVRGRDFVGPPPAEPEETPTATSSFPGGPSTAAHEPSPTTHRHQPPPPFKWRNVICDGCETRNISGPRFKCGTCPDLDLCERCHADKGVVDMVTVTHRDHEDRHAFVRYEDDTDLWIGITCDGCGRRAFEGERFRCEECADFDFCATCRATALHIPWHSFRRLSHPSVLPHRRHNRRHSRRSSATPHLTALLSSE
ncbi:uncharacterized protein EV422DRAFT_51707 [Fimicolochytrium jonesii]|uniref:uncharacterized protein n=1 Tax=Fimicolochytrium jonesii TaxID=1396493 RepID=UPI0022FF0E21|nr:uncharacterized protein EV422DRAFT_51707 [Fimicolochytrium jonesii]KAI8821079.1 hypothetical protein EV422DRAFT_51707 [Fimicolochytrium jonesii]